MRDSVESKINTSLAERLAAMLFDHGVPPRDCDAAAARIIRELGLVAVDPALVETVNAADNGDCGFVGKRPGSKMWCDCVCERCAARLALADHVIEQRKGEG